MCFMAIFAALFFIPASADIAVVPAEEFAERIEFVALQSPRVTLNHIGQPLDRVLRDIQSQSGIGYTVNEQAWNDLRSVSINVSDVPVEEALAELLDGSGYSHRIVNNLIVIERSAAVSQQPQQPALSRITGVVRDTDNRPLAGATVSARGTTRGIVTGADGRYTLMVRPNEVIVFSLVGKNTVEVTYTGQQTIDARLEDRVAEVGQVVVTGYQTLSAERSAGSFSHIAGDVVADKAAFRSSILESLEGLATGFAVNLGEDQHTFTIRGITSIHSTAQPLYVVDGVPMSAENIDIFVNSNDIASVTLLKDATAASIWGSQAANGVVVIVTKRGRDTDRKMSITYDGSFTYRGRPDYNYLEYMSSEMFMKNALEIFDPAQFTWGNVTTGRGGLGANLYPAVMPHEYPMYMMANGQISESERDRLLAEMASRNNRSQVEKYLMSPALFTRHSVSFYGGSETYSVYGSLAYDFNQDDSRNKKDKYNVNVRQDFKLSSWLSLDLITNLSYTDDNNGLQLQYPGNNTYLNGLLPYMMLRDDEGNNLSFSELLMYEGYRADKEAASRLNLDFVPLDDIRRGFDKATSLNSRVSAGIRARLLEGLVYEGRFQYQTNNAESRVFYNEDTYRTREEVAQFAVAGTGGGAPTYHLPVSGGKYRETNFRERNWLVRNQFSFDRSFDAAESHVTALLGMETQANRRMGTTSNVRGYNPQTLVFGRINEAQLTSTGVVGILPNSTANTNTLRDISFAVADIEYRYVSFYANGAYTFRRKYTVNSSIRVDQSNLFGSDPSVQFKPVWSVGAAWNIGREDFLSDVDFLNRLNLRMSYGLGGNSPSPTSGAGAYDILLAGSSVTFAGMGGTTFSILSPANKKLRWERTRTWNLGIDFAVLDSRLSGSIDIYDKETTDMLSPMELDLTTGWYSAMMNVGEMSNKGFELTLNSVNVMTSDFSWRTMLNLSNNKNKVNKLYLRTPVTATNIVHQRFLEGYAANSLFAYQWAGLDNLGDPQVYDVNAAGDVVKVKRTNNLSGPDAARYMGTSQPKWFGGLSNSFRYKNLEMDFMFVFNFGHKMRNDVNRFYTDRIVFNLHRDFDKRWRKEGDENHTNVPSYVSNSATESSRRSTHLYTYSDINVISASYAKLRDLGISYHLPKRFCEKVSAQAIRVRFQVSNLFYIAANNQGIDPEAHSYFSALGPDGANFVFGGVRSLRYGPSWSGSISISF